MLLSSKFFVSQVGSLSLLQKKPPEATTPLLLPLTLTIILGKANAEVNLLDLLLKEVLLVEKEDDRSSSKELVVTYAVEQVQRLMHAILVEEKSGKERHHSTWSLAPFLLEVEQNMQRSG